LIFPQSYALAALEAKAQLIAAPHPAPPHSRRIAKKDRYNLGAL
jgi:hypothetical protein